MNENLLRYNEDAIFCVFDFETEDLNLADTRPWQFSCIIGTTKKIIKEYNLFLRWEDLRVSKKAAEITRFDPFRWEDEGTIVDPEKAVKLMTAIFEKVDYVCGHNIIGFDCHVYNASCVRLGLKPAELTKKILDTSCLIKGLKDKLDIPYKPCDNLFEYQMKMYNTIVRKRGFATLGALCKMFDIEYDTKRAHDALQDVKYNYEGLKKLLWKIEV